MKSKDVYDNDLDYFCDRFINCAECEKHTGISCLWINHMNGNDKLPKIEYKYKKRSLISKLFNWIKI